jgi:hypothetical protein
VDQLNDRRNDIAHGIWYGSHVLRDQVSKEGVKFGNVTLTAPDLEALADRAWDARLLVWEFACGCRPDPDMPRVSDRLAVVEGRVVQNESLKDWKPPRSH